MSDFTSDFWSIYIAVITVLSIAGCVWLLLAMSRAKVHAKPAPGGKETTGHVWDGDLTEYNNPLPRWWFWLFLITIVFSVIYLVVYPGLGKAPGTFGWSSADQYRKEVEAVDKVVLPLYEKFQKQDLKQVAADPQAQGMGERLFLITCAQCHGSDAGGGKGFPSLRDEEWLYGGEPEKIKESILEGRNGVMPALGAALGDDNIKNVVSYVRSLSGLPHDGLKAQLGQTVFANTCAACHGPEGKGNPAIGAPNLANKVWVYGSSEKDITETVVKGRHAAGGAPAMPAHRQLVGEAKAHLLAAYIWGLSNLPATGAARN